MHMNKDNKSVIQMGKGSISNGDIIVFGRVKYGLSGKPSYIVLDSEKDNAGTEGSVFVLSEELWGYGPDGALMYGSDGCSDDDGWTYYTPWQDSFNQKWCKRFGNDNFSETENLSIKPVTKSDDEEHLYDLNWLKCENILNEDRIFFLSIREYYDYLRPIIGNEKGIKYGVENLFWWLRSYNDSEDGLGTVDSFGKILQGEYDDEHKGCYDVYYSELPGAARPAFNIDLNSVLFISDANWKKPDSHILQSVDTQDDISSWRLTLVNNHLYAIPGKAVQDESQDHKIYLPDIICSGKGNRVSVLITNGMISENDLCSNCNNITILCYGQFDLKNKYFVLSDTYDISDWGKKYYVYILEESIHSVFGYESDVAGIPMLVTAPGQMPICVSEPVSASDCEKTTNKNENEYSGEDIRLGAVSIRSGDRIYFGRIPSVNTRAINEETKTCYRVLKVYNNEFFEIPSMFVTSEYLQGTGNELGDVLFDDWEGKRLSVPPNYWQGSDAQKWCKSYAERNFSLAENNALLKIVKDEKEFILPHSKDNIYKKDGYGYRKQNLNGDTVYFLSFEEVIRYFEDSQDRQAIFVRENGHAIFGKWWLRSPIYNVDVMVGCVHSNGFVFDRFYELRSNELPDINDVGYIKDVDKLKDQYYANNGPSNTGVLGRMAARPAFRIKMSNILFSFPVKTVKTVEDYPLYFLKSCRHNRRYEQISYTHFWRLVLSDDINLSIIPNDVLVDKNDNHKIMLPNLLCSGNGNRISVLITDNEGLNDHVRNCDNDILNDTKIISYFEMDPSNKSFVLPEGLNLSDWGKKFFVYVFEESKHGLNGYASDFACTPVLLGLPMDSEDYHIKTSSIDNTAGNQPRNVINDVVSRNEELDRYIEENCYSDNIYEELTEAEKVWANYPIESEEYKQLEKLRKQLKRKIDDDEKYELFLLSDRMRDAENETNIVSETMLCLKTAEQERAFKTYINKPYPSFSGLLDIYMKEKGIENYAELSYKAYLTQTTLSRMRSERNKTMNPDCVWAVAIALGIDLNQTEKLFNSARLSINGAYHLFNGGQKRQRALEYYLINHYTVSETNIELHNDKMKWIGDDKERIENLLGIFI